MQQEREVIAPASLPQELFINSDADITIASGSAGSSKSYSILLKLTNTKTITDTKAITNEKLKTNLNKRLNEAYFTNRN